MAWRRWRRSLISPQVSVRSLSLDSTLLSLRPLLDVPKARLLATLRRRGIAWIEDPSNEATAFERTRLRAARDELARLGLTNDMLALSAARLGRVRGALDAATAALPRARKRERFHGSVAVASRLIATKLREAGAEIALRVLGGPSPLQAVPATAPPSSKLEAMADGTDRATKRRPGAWTLARAKVMAKAAKSRSSASLAATPLPRFVVARGARRLWDGRFVVHACPDACRTRPSRCAPRRCGSKQTAP